ncbi:MAG: DUF1674 domain-containing protein [Gammaproteobacteria bacterium]|nr:DUF1674 domain-containing protein [Gammaproteobacteria bacterium]
MSEEHEKQAPEPADKSNKAPVSKQTPKPLPKEYGGAPGPEPTRYGDWESNGRCTDF